MMTKIEMQAMDAIIGIYREMKKANEINWEQRRYEIAKDSMAAILSNPEIVDEVTEEGEPIWGAPVAIARTSVTLADLLIAELKKEKE